MIYQSLEVYSFGGKTQNGNQIENHINFVLIWVVYTLSNMMCARLIPYLSTAEQNEQHVEALQSFVDDNSKFFLRTLLQAMNSVSCLTSCVW